MSTDIQTSEQTSGPMLRIGFAGAFGKGLLALYVGLMLIWLLFPIVLVLLASFQGKLEVSLSLSDVSLDAYKAIPRAYWEAFWFTVRIAITATILALLVAVPAAWAMNRGRLAGSRLMSNLVLIPDVCRNSSSVSRF